MRLGRVYDDPAPGDGARVLVDRLWPRGIRKEDPRVGQWCKDVAPSTELRKWYGHRPDRAVEFALRYRAELGEPQVAEVLSQLRAMAQHPLILLTATKEVGESHLPVLAEFLR